MGTALAGPPETFSSVRATGTPVVLVAEPTGLDGPAAKIRAVAAALGVPGRDEALARTVETELAEAAALAERAIHSPRVAALYLRGERVQQVFGTGTGIDALLEAAGAVDVGSELGIDDIAPIGEEAMVVAAPDVLVVTTSGLEAVGGVDGLLATLPALAQTPAGRDRRVLAYDDQLLLGGGPRAGEALAALVADLHPELDQGPRPSRRPSRPRRVPPPPRPRPSPRSRRRRQPQTGDQTAEEHVVGHRRLVAVDGDRGRDELDAAEVDTRGRVCVGGGLHRLGGLEERGLGGDLRGRVEHRGVGLDDSADIGIVRLDPGAGTATRPAPRSAATPGGSSPLRSSAPS